MIEPDWKKAVPKDFPPSSRVWVYQSNRPFSEEEEEAIGGQLNDYINNWVSHNRPVRGWATILFNQFIVLMADDTSDRLCGSAVDDSLRFIKNMEEQYGVELLNRMNMGFAAGDALRIIPMTKVEQKVAHGIITEETLFFNNAVSTKQQWLDEWIQPFGESFLWSRIAQNVTHSI